MNVKSGAIKFIISTLFLFGLGVIVLNFVSYNRSQTNKILETRVKIYKPQQIVSTVTSGIIPDFQSNKKPAKSIGRINQTDIVVRKYNISIKDNEKSKDVFVREAGTGDYHILLLDQSKVWENIGTLHYLSKWGYHPFAVDTPIDQANVQWLRKVIKALRLTNLVIISPSMSGQLTLPYMMQLKKRQKLIRGVVLIAPVGTDRFPMNEYKQIKIPTFIVYSINDTKYQSTFEKLQQIPKNKILLMKNASYVTKPMEFHNELRQYLHGIYRSVSQKSLIFDTTKRKIS